MECAWRGQYAWLGLYVWLGVCVCVWLGEGMCAGEGMHGPLYRWQADSMHPTGVLTCLKMRDFLFLEMNLINHWWVNQKGSQGVKDSIPTQGNIFLLNLVCSTLRKPLLPMLPTLYNNGTTPVNSIRCRLQLTEFDNQILAIQEVSLVIIFWNVNFPVEQNQYLNPN